MDKFLLNSLNQTEEAETALALGFAQRLGTLAKYLGATAASTELVQLVAAEISRATTHGHVCLSLVPLAAQLNHTLPSLRANLLASSVVCNGDAEDIELLPLVLDTEDRLYLARYYAYERRLAQALVQRSMVAQTAIRIGWGDAGTPTSSPSCVGVPASPQPMQVSLQEQLARYFKTPLAQAEIDIQQVATALALSNPLTIISGGPGTGKTTTVVGILACLLEAEPSLRIALAAPTGRAAQRLAQALALNAHHLPATLAARLPHTASTLHRLLGNPHLPNHSGLGFPLTQAVSLPYDVVIVDEASMLDITLAVQLIEALAPTTKLILLGDKNQLSAVEAGAVFAELSAQPSWTQPYLEQLANALQIDLKQLSAALPTVSNQPDETRPNSSFEPLANCVIWLERNYRFAADSAIGCLSRAINAGSPAQMLATLSPIVDNPKAEVVLLETAEENLSETILAQLAAGFEAYIEALVKVLDEAFDNQASASHKTLDCAPLFEALNRYRVLAAMRTGPRGVDRLNALLTWAMRQAFEAKKIRLTYPTALQPSPPNDEWFAGRPVMMMRNDYALELFNGDIGIALPYKREALRVVFPTPRGGWRWFAPAVLPPHETAWAMTVHKSQGSEFNCAAIVLPATPARTLTRALLYTAVTRARSQVLLVGTPDVLTYAVTHPAQRDSGLSTRLQEAAMRMEMARENDYEK